MELDKKRIEDAIIEQVSNDFLAQEDLSGQIRAEVNRRIDKLFKDNADAQINDAINDAIRNGFEREYCRINAWGQKEGEPTTIRKELEKAIGDYWNTTVDRNGKPDTSYGNKTTRAEWLMTQMVAADFKDSMKQHIINLSGSLKDGLRQELHKTVNLLLTERFHVKSLDDQKLQDGYNPHDAAK